MKTWGLIAALAAAWFLFRSKKPGAAGSTTKAGTDTVDVPAGTQIGQIGARIENPEALNNFARAIEASAVPRIVSVTTVGEFVYRTWSDGRYQILKGSTGSGNNPSLIYDSARDTVGEIPRP